MRFARSAVFLAMALVTAGPAHPQEARTRPAPHKVRPRAAPAIYVTQNYALTLRMPKGATYCPLPDSWVGSDHGSVFFLTPPAWCAGFGYPSSSRGFGPDRTPRIELYYGYRDEDMRPPSRCRAIGTAIFLGGRHQLCPSHSGGSAILTLTGLYEADSAAEAVLTLVTTKDRLTRDLKTFRQVAATVKPCRPSGQRAQRGAKPGPRAPCPIGSWF